MANGENITSLLSGINWSVEADLFLPDFVERVSLPHLAVITKGQHLSVGAPNVANPGLKPYVLVHSRQKVRKVLAQIVKEGRGRTVATEQKVAIPEGFSGFFEILSEDGKPVKCIESVQELSKKFPELCLVRGSFKACLPDTDGELRNLHRTRIVEEGEILTLVGQFNFKRETFLRCFDEYGNSVYLRMSQKARFSPVARKDAITGVHYIRNLLDAKRFPLTVKLVTGTFPISLRPGGGNSPMILRLLSIVSEDIVMMYVVHQKDHEFLSVPLNSHLKLASSTNHQQIVCRPEFRQLCETCDEILPNHLNRITAFTDPMPNLGVPADTAIGDSEAAKGSEKEQSDPSVVDEEIDQLYDYIRGLAPLPSSCQKTVRYPPPPPPLETLPSRLSADSKNSSGSPTSPSPQGRKPASGSRERRKAERNHRKSEGNLASAAPAAMEHRKSEGNILFPEHKISKYKDQQRRLSRSSEKLLRKDSDSPSHESGKNDFAGNKRGDRVHPDSPTKHANSSKPKSGKSRPRPVSMVLSENTVLFPGHHPMADYHNRYVSSQFTSKPAGPSIYTSQAFPSVTNLYIPEDPVTESMRHPSPNKTPLAYLPGPPPPYWGQPLPIHPRNHGYGYRFPVQY